MKDNDEASRVGQQRTKRGREGTEGGEGLLQYLPILVFYVLPLSRSRTLRWALTAYKQLSDSRNKALISRHNPRTLGIRGEAAGVQVCPNQAGVPTGRQ